MTRSESQQQYLEFLRTEGYRPELDAVGDIRLKIEGRVYFVVLEEEDPGYVRLLFPNFWSIETPEERRVALEACERATARTKVAKVFLSRDDTSAAFEMLCAGPESFTAVFPRALRILRTAVDHYVKHMREARTAPRLVGLA